jgi:glutathione S-transferase
MALPDGVESLRLHHFPATRSARAKWALHETVGDAFSLARVDLYAGEQRRPEFLALNPNHAVPTLEIAFSAGRRLNLFESVAIVLWLAETVPAAGLTPSDPRERAEALQMAVFGAAHVDMILWEIRVHEHLLPPAERDERAIARARRKFETEIEPQLEARLAAGPFICGERFTLADIVIGYDVFWARGYRLARSAVFKAYLDRLSARPGWRAAFSDIGEFRLQPPEPGERKAQASDG